MRACFSRFVVILFHTAIKFREPPVRQWTFRRQFGGDRKRADGPVELLAHGQSDPKIHVRLRAIMVQRRGAGVFVNRIFIEPLPSKGYAQTIVRFRIIVVSFNRAAESSFGVFK